MAFVRRPRDEKKDFEETLLDIARVTRVVAGGKRLSFRVTLAIGNKAKHQVGIGVSKGKDVAQAIQKAGHKARKNLIIVPIVHETIPHEVQAKYKSAVVIIKPAKKGKGIRAGGAVRTVLKLADVPNANAKILSSSSNALNNARVAVRALAKLKDKSLASSEKKAIGESADIKKEKKDHANSSNQEER